MRSNLGAGLLEVRFISDAQFNTAANRIAFKNSLAQAIADAWRIFRGDGATVR